MRLEGHEGVSHVDVWRKSGPGRGTRKCKGPAVCRCVYGTAWGQVAAVQRARGESGRCLSDMGGGPGSNSENFGFSSGSGGNQWRILTRGEMRSDICFKGIP